MRRDSPFHILCRQWLIRCAAEGGQIRLTELAEVALLRIAILRGLDLVPMDEVLAFWAEDLWPYSGILRLSPSPSHPELLARFITGLGLGGNDVNDGWLAAWAMGHHAVLVSTDGGFARFPGLDFLNPVGGG